MRKNVTEIVFLLDRSGSMAGLEKDTIGGFNRFVEEQAQHDGETKVTAVLFDHESNLLWDGVDARKVRLSEENYQVRGSTALLDAVGKTILQTEKRMADEGEPDQLLFVITTDGQENSSREFTYPRVRSLIKEKSNWEFIFMGANLDVAKEADQLGVDAANAFSFEASEEGVGMMYDSVSELILEKRSSE